MKTFNLTDAEKELLNRLLVNERFRYLQHCHKINSTQFKDSPEKQKVFLDRGMEYAKSINMLIEVLGIDPIEERDRIVGTFPGNLGRGE